MIVHDNCVASKTITLKMDAYERLKAAKQWPRESFSEVMHRLSIPHAGFSVRQLLAARKAGGPILSESDCASIDELNALDALPESP